MDKIEARKYQLAQMELLLATDEICKKLGIDYYLIGGTLLGAIRHKGFIPWDIDTDIAMKRADYEKFRQYWAENESDKFFYQHYSTEKNHTSPHAVLKIKNTNVVIKTFANDKYKPTHNGIYMDIFPLDEAPVDKKQQERQMKRIRNFRRIISLKIGREYAATSGVKRFIKRTIQFLMKPITFEFLNSRLDKTMSKYNGCGSGTLVSMASHYSYWKQLMPKEVYGEPCEVVFEDKKLKAPAQTEDYLTRIYGDFMKLPPEEGRYDGLEIVLRVDY